MEFKRSKVLYEKAKRFLPGGVNSPVRAFKSVGGQPFFVKEARGSKIYDVDGNEYIDYVCSWGPMILGHAHPEVISFVKEVAEKGTSFGIPCELEVLMAEAVVDAIPSVEKVRFVNSGTEATMSAIRLARGYTKRNKVVKFEGCYHGHVDYLLVKAGSGVLTFGIPGTPGVPEDFAKHTLIAKFNDIESVRALFEKYGDDIACVILEPVMGNAGVILPEGDFLKELRSITRQYGALLIFDEVITGFRVSYSGAQGFFGIEPDLTCLGKIIGGGFPVGAYGGKAEFMNHIAPDGPVYQAGTLSGNPVAMAAGLKTLEILKRDNPYPELEAKANYFKENAYKLFEEKGIPATINGIASMSCIFFTEGPVKSYDDAVKSNTELYAKFFWEMLKNGVYLAPSQFEAAFISVAHTQEDLDRTLEAIKKSLANI
ncbi:glutamate-1-semialdehyde 2,1-aminomutase [Thermosulfidibacter takaii ABI70S6]|uniref:Glutamate-1-semialdehyde 2,1-aminomutase n=2 Tax=Thermosulfidibacter takaii TaxID=412593 RepID=A0A0S3QSL2_THET7|nr:glutamate-1-semialdehyde 2,1-aminomutase [Thermosulfidibacter takaii]BAT71327.1 glutamate-1-semialdehyde 2,1-aminomutase [Thermosulfidibacter takaii ABI70S6]